jgi:hypothetical protein
MAILGPFLRWKLLVVDRIREILSDMGSLSQAHSRWWRVQKIAHVFKINQLETIMDDVHEDAATSLAVGK